MRPTWIVAVAALLGLGPADAGAAGDAPPAADRPADGGDDSPDDEDERAEKTPPPGAIVPSPTDRPLAIPGSGGPFGPAPGSPAGAMATEPPPSYAYPAYTEGVAPTERLHLEAQELPPPAPPPPRAGPPPGPAAPTAEPIAAPLPERRRERGGLFGGFGHATLGAGPAWTPVAGGALLTGQARLSVGATAWAVVAYAGGSVELGGSGFAPWTTAGVGRVGLALPLPRGRFLIGGHGGGGVWTAGAAVGPVGVAGPEIGFVSFDRRGRLGLRVAWELDAVFRAGGAENLQWLLGAGLAF